MTIEHAPGVYFGLPADEYHADPALGSTDVKRLLHSPPDFYWHSAWNPLRPEHKPTPSQVWGSAFHKLILEGRAAFERAYTVEPHKSDPEFNGCRILDTVDDLKTYCGEFGLRVTGSKIELIERVEAFHTMSAKLPQGSPLLPPVIWQRRVEAHKEALEREGKQPLSLKQYGEILLSEGMITKNPALREAFVGGHPEVSVFWEERGIRCKARIDYLKVGATVDLKSFRMRDGVSIHRSIYNSIANYRYDIQAAHYVIGRQHLQQHILDGAVFGDGIDDDWLLQVASAGKPPFLWVFYSAEGAPVSRGYMLGGGPLDAALHQRQNALSAYLECLATFGTDLWVDTSPINRIDTEDLPAWMGA